MSPLADDIANVHEASDARGPRDVGAHGAVPVEAHLAPLARVRAWLIHRRHGVLREPVPRELQAFLELLTVLKIEHLCKSRVCVCVCVCW